MRRPDFRTTRAQERIKAIFTVTAPSPRWVVRHSGGTQRHSIDPSVSRRDIPPHALRGGTRYSSIVRSVVVINATGRRL